MGTINARISYLYRDADNYKMQKFLRDNGRDNLSADCRNHLLFWTVGNILFPAGGASLKRTL